MAGRIGLAALAVAAIAGFTTAARADERQENGVTVIRGSTATVQNAAGPGSGGSPQTPANTPAIAAGQSGMRNAVNTGSSNAGGAIANPSPEAGR